MKCPKCKKELAENIIKCPNCGIKIGRLCPNCNAYNLITNTTCISCGETLLKVCSKCHSINLPNATNCRKCGTELISKQERSKEEEIIEKQEQTLKYNANYYNLDNAKDVLITAINDNQIKIISINGNNDVGKNYLVNNLMGNLNANRIAWFTGKCTPYTQLTPLGYFQDVLLHLFNITNFCVDKKQLKKESMQFFKDDFDNLENFEIIDLLNILYPEKTDKFQNINKNKQKTIKIIVKIFEKIASKMNIVLYIDNMEYIDNLSYEILNILQEESNLENKLKYIITFSKEQSAINCFTTPNLKEENYADITITPLDKEQLEPIFDNYKKLELSNDMKAKILYFSNSEPTHIEQLISLIADCKNVGNEIKLFSELKDTIKFRLDYLKQYDYPTYLLLCAVTILGCKFYPIILNSIFDMDFETITKTLNKLVKQNYLISNQNFYEFKSMKVWEEILRQIKTDTEIFRAVNQALYQILSNYTLSTPTVLGYVAQNLKYEDQTFEIWTKCTQMASYIGDTGLYIILQKQILSIIDNLNLTQRDLIKRTIYAELGKLLEPDNPKMAMEYLPKAITLLSENEFNDKIELLGFLASCAMKTKNYHGVIECINQTIPLIPDNFKVEIAMLKTRELKALEELGNTGTIINLTDNDIIPLLESALSKTIQCKTISEEKLFNTWIQSQIYLAKALSMQSDNRSFKVLNSLFEIFEANHIDNSKLFVSTQITLAFAHTINGDIRTSVNVLSDILSQNENTNTINEQLMSEINLISILNKLFMNSDDLSYNELFEAAQYADNAGDDFTKNILKLILGRLMQDRTSAKEAIGIYTKQIEYFAQEQNSVGVLLGWYFVSEAKFAIDGPKSALDIAQKALEIAQSPSICNYYFMLLLNKLIGEMYLALQDYESAKMYIEQAINIAKSFNLQYQLVNLYVLYGKYLQELAITTPDKKIDYVLSAQEMNKKAEIISDDLKLISLKNEVEKAGTVLKSFCQMNGIILK